MKFLKNVLMFFGLLFLSLTIIVGFILFKGVKENGDVLSLFKSFAAKKIAEKMDLSPIQVQLLEDGNYEAVVEDLKDNITPEQINCAVEVLGESRAVELAEKQNPTPSEIIKLSKCY